MMGNLRRLSVGASALAIALASMTACTTKTGSKSSSDSGPLEIGLVVTLSGAYAEIGQSHEAGAKLAVQQINAEGGIDGHQVKLVVKDEAGDPNTSVQRARELIGSGVKLIAGYTVDPDCLAASPVISGAGGVLLGLSCQGDSLTEDKLEPGYFQIAPSNQMLSAATAKVAAKSGMKDWQGLGPDYDYGHEVWSNFTADLHKDDPSAKLGKAAYVPLTSTDTTPYINSLTSALSADSAKHTGLYMSTFAATTIALAKQGKAYNFFSKYGSVLNVGGSTPTAEALGVDTPPMTFIYDYFDGAYQNATNTKFVDGYHKAYGASKRPNGWAYEGYTDMLAFKAAADKAGSTDPTKIREALAGMTFDTPKGPLTFRKEDHLPQTPVTSWSVVGDAKSPGGFKITSAEAIPADEVMPAAK